MQQGTINFDPPLSRSSDPLSSRAAERRTVNFGTVASHEGRIVGVVCDHPGWTGDEIAACLGLTNVQVMRRMRALERRGLVRRGEQRASRITGRLGLTWWPAESAVEDRK